jgi:FkbM family methyltransferase
MKIPAGIDPPEVQDRLWAGLGGEVGWDIGANIGQSVPRMRMAARRVLCFEPAEESYAILERAWKGNDGLSFRNIAVSDHDGEVELAVRSAPIASGQLVATGMPYHGEDYGPGSPNWGNEEGSRIVPCRTADSLAREYGKPDFIKVDTEGHELKVLQGASQLLARGTDWLIEFHSPELFTECQKVFLYAGYTPYVIRHPHYPPGSQMWHAHGWLKAFRPPAEPSATDVTRPVEKLAPL